MKLALRALLLAGAFALCLASACDGSDPAPVETEQARVCAAFGAVSCGCGPQPLWCKKREAAYCLEALALPDTGITIERLRECTTSLEASPCGDKNVPGCGLTFGARPIGAACLSNQQCGSGLCGGGSWQSCGVCVAPLAQGESGCVPLACDQGLYCANNYVCAAQLATGEACANVYACSPPNGCVGGVCAPQRATGSACEYSSDCRFPDVCIASSRTCGALPAPLQAGEPCPGVGTCDVAKGLFCAFTPGSVGVCEQTKTLAVGATCGAYDGSTRCVDGAECVRRGATDTMVCVPFLPEDASCEPSDSAVACEPWLFCVGHACRRLPIPQCG